MDACSGFEALRRGEEDGLLRVKKVRFVGDIIKIKIHSSCAIEDFVETHLCKLCVILRSRALRVVCPH